MESSIMQLVKGGYSNKYWSAGIKLSVYKQFIRPIAEYGLQLKIMDTAVLDILEAAQLKASLLFKKQRNPSVSKSLSLQLQISASLKDIPISKNRILLRKLCINLV